MKQEFKKLFSALSALAVMIAALPITELPAIAEEEMAEMTNEPTDFSLVEDDLATEDDVSNSDLVVSTFDTPMIMAAQTGVTKEEWIHDLVNAFDMSIEDESTIESHFTDIADSPYAYDIDLAANYGVFDIESESFDPNDLVTREFAAHTANYCFGYLDDGTTVTFSDSDAIYYEYDAIVSVQRGWFSVQNGKFVPDGYMTDAECDKILDYAKAAIENISIDENAENTIVFSDSVIQLDSSAKASLFNNQVTIIDTNGLVKKGSVFSVTMDGVPYLFKAANVTKDVNGKTIIDVENADFTQYVKSVSAQGYAIVDYKNAVVYNDTEDSKKTSAAQLYNAPPIMRKPQSFSKSISISRTFDLDGIEVTLSGSISNITVAYDMDYGLGGLNSFYLDVSADADIEAVVKSELKTTSSKEINLARIPAFCTGILNVDLVVTATVSLSGETTLSYGWIVDGGVSYSKNDGWRITKNFQKKAFTYESKTTGKIAAKAAATAYFCGSQIAEAYVMGGEQGIVDGVIRSDGTECLTLNAYYFAEYGANATIFGKSFNKSNRFIDYNNSPVKLWLHLENGKVVDHCTYGEDKSLFTQRKPKITASSNSYVGYSQYGTLFDGEIKLLNSAEYDSVTGYQTWTESRTLSEDITVNGTLYIEKSVDLNGHTLTVNGDLIQKGGTMNINSGTLNVNGDYIITSKTHFDEESGKTVRDSTGVLYMQYANGYVNVHGNFHTYSESKNTLTKGELRIWGNFYQHSGEGIDDGDTTNFCPNSAFHIIFDGMGEHEVYFDSTSSYLAGVQEENGATVKITNMFSGFKLTSDVIVSGDLIMDGYNKMDLGGYSLTINGDLIQQGGQMVINEGTLAVNGNYTLSNATHYDEKEGIEKRDSTGSLYMDNALGNVYVYGDFSTYSEVFCYQETYDVKGYNYFNRGKMTIFGNLYQYSGEGLDDGYLDENRGGYVVANGIASNFLPSENFHLVFSGKGVHEVKLEGNYATISGVEEEDGATIKITSKLYGFKLTNDIIVSDVMSLSSGTLDLNGHTLTVNGNFNQNGGTINVGGGTLLISKDYTLGNTTHYNAAEDRTYRDSTATIKMDYATGMVQVGGDLNVYSESTNTLQRGTLQIRGGLYQYSGNGLDDGVADNFYPSSTFNLVFSGTGVHEIYFESTKSNITGVKEENGATIKITGVLAGVTLNNDIVVTGDMPLDYGTMNLNGHTLTVNGNLTQKGGSMVIGSGTLDVSGDYTLSNQTHYDEKEDKTYRDSTGTLYMDNATGNVNIKGDFKTYSEQSCSSNSSYNYFNKGTMTIYGNFYQYSGDGLDDGDTKNFVPSDNFNIIFTGEKTHIFSSDSKTTKTGTITLNKGGKVTFKGNLAGLENVENCSFMSDGTIVSIDKNTISAAYPGTGKVTIVNASNTKATINVTITDSIKGDVNCDGKVTIADAVLLQKWLLANPSAFLPCWKTADLCEDNRIDVFDLCLLKRMLVENR